MQRRECDATVWPQRFSPILAFGIDNKRRSLRNCSQRRRPLGHRMSFVRPVEKSGELKTHQ
jgi:hypothetical protein